MKRSYRMSARARAVEETRQRILDATVALHLERLTSEILLDHVADRAGVSVQTVLRHFGNREALIEAALVHGREVVIEERQAPVGDLEAAIEVITAHYEARGDGAILLLAQEGSEPLAARITDQGRATHRQWVGEVFAPWLAKSAAPEALTDLLVVATDVYTWKLLRRDRGLSLSDTRARMRTLARAILEVSHG